LSVLQNLAQDEYVVVALPTIQAQDFTPLDQTTVGAITQEFTSHFLYVLNSSEDVAAPQEEAGSEEEGSSVSYPEVSTGGNEEDVNVEEAVEEFDWNRILFTEAVTDPQQDHSESTEENGILFDPYPGTGTVGSTDEYIEIFNGTDSAVDVSLWSLNMVDGTDVQQDLNSSDWDVYFSNEGSLESFGAGEFLVLGNPEGAMNNSISFELTNEDGEIVDALEVDDANASDLNDEAYTLSADGTWNMDFASPGYFLE